MIRLSTISICFFLALTLSLNGQANKTTENYPGNIQLKSGTNIGALFDGGAPSTFSNGFLLPASSSSLRLSHDGVTRISMIPVRPSSLLTTGANVPLVTLTGTVPSTSQTFMTFTNDNGTPSDSWNFNLSTPAQGNGTIFEFVYQVDGGSPITAASISSSGISNSSDRRLKTNIETIKTALPTLMKLNASYYNRKLNLEKGEFGFIAQEVEEVLPEIISVIDTENGEQYMMNYIQIIPLLTKGLQEQQQIIESLKERIEILEN